jgi:hypothetical protein
MLMNHYHVVSKDILGLAWGHFSGRDRLQEIITLRTNDCLSPHIPEDSILHIQSPDNMKSQKYLLPAFLNHKHLLWNL